MFQILIFLGIVVRFLLIGVPGFKADVAFWKGWGLAVADKGVLWLVNNTNYNYPPGFAYVLWLVNKIYALLADPYNINQYWLDNNYLYLFLIKIITILADLGIVWVIIKIYQNYKLQITNSKFQTNPKLQIPNSKQIQNPNDKNSKKENVLGLKNLNLRFIWNLGFSTWNFNLGHLLALFYFLNPVAIFDGVIWGQVDQYGLFLFMVSLYLLIIDRPNWATAVFVVSFLMKFQNIIFIPLFYLYLYKRYSFTGLIKSAQISLAVFALVTFPFWWFRQMAGLIRLFTINANWFPWLSLNAFNLWWLVAKGEGLRLSDKNLVLGIMDAKQIGLLLFSFFYLVSALRVALAKKERLFREFVLALVLAVFAFFHLLTQSHERYLYHLLGLVPLLYLVRKEKNFGRLMVFLMLLSLGMFFNMYLSAAMNYPDQVYWPFTDNLTRSVSFYISYYQIGLFIYFIRRYLLTGWERLGKLGVVVGLMALTVVIVFKNLPYLLGQPVSLTKLTPIDWRQDYLEPMTNMTVESARGVFYWNRLSNNYYFYKKGIGSHANSEISYGLGGRFSRLRTDFGIDTEGDAGAKAVFIIEGDGREIYKSKVLGRFDLPGQADVSIKGVNILTLKINTGGESNFGVHADWLEPVVIR